MKLLLHQPPDLGLDRALGWNLYPLSGRQVQRPALKIEQRGVSGFKPTSCHLAWRPFWRR